MDTPGLSVELDGKVLVVQMDDGKANALSHAMIAGLNAAFDRAAAEASGILLVGRPGRFSGGFDLKVMMQGPEAVRGLLDPGAELLIRCLEHPQPIVIACTGHAIAAGALLLLAVDSRIGTAGDFKIGLNEVAQGMTIPALGTELARHRLSPQALVRATSFAELFNPEAAAQVGYLDQVVAPEDLLETAREEARRLAELPAQAFAGTKERVCGPVAKLIREQLDADLTALLGPAS